MATTNDVAEYESRPILDGVLDKEKENKEEDTLKTLQRNEAKQKRLEQKIKNLAKQVKNFPKDWQAVVRLLLAKSDLVKQKQQVSTLQYQIEINKYRTAKKTKKKSSGDGSSGNAKLDKMVQWFESHKGKITYSMAGSRNGSDGTGDCSGCMSQAMKDAGFNIQGLPSTVTLGAQLKANGFKIISKNQNWTPKKGDIVMMSHGSSMADSGGAGGHVGCMKDNNTFISCDFSTGGALGTAVSEWPIVDYLTRKQVPYFEVWRYTK